MQTIRRAYMYGVAFVSLELVLWGLIGLARSILLRSGAEGNAQDLAAALALLLVGAPVFGLHWNLAQRSASQDTEERASRLRAVFLYGVLIATLIPVVQNILAMLSRFLLQVFSLNLRMAAFGGDQTTTDNLVAVAFNLLVAAYFYRVLRVDWSLSDPGDAYREVRRLYRFVWLFYSLALAVFGVQQVLQYLLLTPVDMPAGDRSNLANGLAFVLVGAPLWYMVEQILGRARIFSEEKSSLLRLGTLYAISFLSVIIVLVGTTIVLSMVLNRLLGMQQNFDLFMGELAIPLALIIPVGVMWAYYGRQLQNAIREGAAGPRPAALRRVYSYVLAFLGIFAAVFGLHLLLRFLIETTLPGADMIGTAQREMFSAGLSLLVVGLPLWFFSWRPMQVEARLEGETGDHARRSLVRKGYLYLILFAAVVGLMVAAAVLLFRLLSALLGDPPEMLLRRVLEQVEFLLLFGLLFAYHGLALRADGRLAAQALARRHARYPVLVLTPASGDVEPEPTSVFAASLVTALQRDAPEMPVAVHPVSRGVPDDTLSAARAVIMPSDLIASPPEAIRLWLNAYKGEKVVAPAPTEGWYWVFGSGRALRETTRRTALIVRLLAEGEAVPASKDAPPWMPVIYVFAALFGLELLIILLTSGAQLFNNM